MRGFGLSLVFALLSTPAFSEAALQFERPSRLIDFRISYPFPQFSTDSIEKRQHNYAGVDLTYQISHESGLGLQFSPVAWFVPVEVEGSKAVLYSLALTTGVHYRFAPRSFMDPTLYVSSGLAASNAGDHVKGRWNYPVLGKLAMNLWRQTDPFQDRDLAFTVSGTTGYVFEQLDVLEPWYIDVGVAFRGSF